MPWTAEDLPDLTGRTVVVTGASGGLGAITVRELARVGARVVMAVRDLERGRRLAETLPGAVEVRELDVASLGSVRAFAQAWSGPVDVLVNNAGIMDVPLQRTADGFERQLATNYLGPFALTTLLLPHVTDRVVSVSSQLHRRGSVHLDDVNTEHRRYRSMDAYADSKLALVLFAQELQRRLVAAGSPVLSVVAHPGIASTNLAAHSRAGRVTGALRFLFNDPERGAASLLYAATQPVPGGAYVGPTRLGGLRGDPGIGEPAPAALDRATAAALWERTAALTGTGGPVAVA